MFRKNRFFHFFGSATPDARADGVPPGVPFFDPLFFTDFGVFATSAVCHGKGGLLGRSRSLRKASLRKNLEAVLGAKTRLFEILALRAGFGVRGTPVFAIRDRVPGPTFANFAQTSRDPRASGRQSLLVGTLFRKSVRTCDPSLHHVDMKSSR